MSRSEAFDKATWIGIQTPKNQSEIEKLQEKFGPGESEAIVLAQELRALLLIDEWSAIREARTRGIEITSTHLTLIEAKKKGLIGSVKEELDGLIAAGFRTTAELIQESLKKAEEK